MKAPRVNRFGSLWLVMLAVLVVSQVSYGLGNSPVGLAALEQYDQLPMFRDGVRIHQFSSFDRTGGNDHDGFDYEFSWLYQDGSDYVVFEDEGPGCVQSIWVTGWSYVPSQVGVRVYVDHESTPRYEANNLYDFFGDDAPFIEPLSYERYNTSPTSGGYNCYLPIPYREHCKVCFFSSDGNGTRVPFYHVTYHEYDSAEGVSDWTGSEDSSVARSIVSNVGSDPKSTSGNQVISDVISIPTGSTATLASITGAGRIQSIKVDPPSSSAVLSGARLRMTWDYYGSPSVDVPLGEFFGSRYGEFDVTSLSIGMSTSGDYYCYYPMPYWSHALIELVNDSGQSISGFDYEIQYSALPYPVGDAGYFHATRTYTPSFTNGEDFIVLETTGKGHVVGMSGGLSSGSGNFLEGDERVYVDGSLTPQMHGTGMEDYFNGGWYFMSYTEHSFAFHGAPYLPIPEHQLYRQHITDCIPFNRSIRFGIEHGPQNDQPGSSSCVAYYYRTLDGEVGMSQTDELDVGDGGSESAHGYSVTGQTWSGSISEEYDGDDDDITIQDDGRAFNGSSSFTVSIYPGNEGVLLRRRMDQSVGRQRADVRVDGSLVGRWYTPDTNGSKPDAKRWYDAEFMIPASHTSGKSSLAVEIDFVSSDTGSWNEYHYWVYTKVPTGVDDPCSPTVPGVPQIGPVTAGSVALSWTASDDNVGVAGYRVYRNGTVTPVGTTATASYTDSSVSECGSYQYYARAYDAAGNNSELSGASDWVNTPGAVQEADLDGNGVVDESDVVLMAGNWLVSGCGTVGDLDAGGLVDLGDFSGLAGAWTGPDTEAPSVPTGLAVTATSQSTVSLGWDDSTDHVGVTGYRVFRDGGSIGTTGGSAYTDSGLAADVTYTYRVSAFDGSGNESGQSGSVVATTVSNLLANGSFEDGSSGSLPDHWGGNSSYGEWDDTVAVDGSCSLKVIPGASYFNQTVSTDSSKAYTLGGWMKLAAGSSGSIRLRVAGAFPGSVDTSSVSGTEWSYQDVLVDKSVAEYRVDCVTDALSAGTGWFDAISLVETN